MKTMLGECARRNSAAPVIKMSALKRRSEVVHTIRPPGDVPGAMHADGDFVDGNPEKPRHGSSIV
ncbi:hypothetical protein D3C80_1500160 [compost metagenome]